MSTLFIYFRTGIDIYRNHRELRQFSRTEVEINASSTWVNTEITVASEVASKDQQPTRHSGSPSLSPDAPLQNHIYSVNITASNHGTTPGSLRRSITRAEWSYAKCAALFFTAMFAT